MMVFNVGREKKALTMGHFNRLPFVICMLGTVGNAATANGEDPDSAKIFDKAIRSMVYISATSTDGKTQRDLIGIVLDLEQKLVVTDLIGEKESICIAFPEFGEDKKLKTD